MMSESESPLLSDVDMDADNEAERKRVINGRPVWQHTSTSANGDIDVDRLSAQAAAAAAAPNQKQVSSYVKKSSTAKSMRMHASESWASVWQIIKGGHRSTILCCCILIMVVPLTVVVVMLGEKHEQDERNFELSIEHGAVWSDYAKLLNAAQSGGDVKLSDSLYLYTCGKLIANAQAGPSSAFADMHARISASLESIAADGWPIIGNWFDGCMDTEQRDRIGPSPLQELAMTIDDVIDGPSFTAALVQLHLAGVPALFTVYTAPDEMNLNVNSLYVDAAYAYPGGANSSELFYAIAAFLGEEAAEAALWVEYTLLAPYVMSAADKRRFELTYTPVDVPQSISPSGLLDWPAFLVGILGDDAPEFPVVGNASRLVLVQPAYASHVDSLLLRAQRSGSWQELKSYLLYRMIYQFYNDLPVQNSDQAADPDYMAQECLASVEAALGDILGHYYVAQNFPASSKQAVNEIVERTLVAFERRLNSLEWMDEPTRAEALRKLAAIKPMVGYPDDWDDDIPPYRISETDHLQNVLDAAALGTRRNMDSLFSAPNPSHWLMTAYTVNAYYSSGTIVLPAGILSGPFFHPNAPLEANYGGIGMVIGHEEAHSLDDQGSQYNADGMRVQWWSEFSAAAYANHTQCVIDLYDSFETPSGKHVNGAMTLGENIADLGGINIAYEAYEDALAAQFPEKSMLRDYEQAIKRIFGMSRQQLFFRSYAYSWCSRMSESAADYLLENDVHSPPRWRVDGASSQSPHFAEAFRFPMRPGACSVL